MKICSQCKKNKKNSEFYKNSSNGECQVKCKECTKKNARANYYKNKVTKKKCVRCEIIKKLDLFHKNKYTPDGHQSICKLCKKASSQKIYLEKTKHLNLNRRPEKPAMYYFEKFCFKCKTVKDKKKFNKNKANKDGLQNYCKICTKIANKKYRTKPSETKQKAIEKEVKESWKNNWVEKDWKETQQKKNWVPGWLYNLITK